ncbi:MAG: hypothetical protein IT359_16015 [Gemmatimonadaceae bacterium]|nr:hypothetical protein [Gemmatimonadaceae bacterium]
MRPPPPPPPAAATALATIAACALAMACGNDGTSSVSGQCAPTARYPNAIGCAYVFGRITDPRGLALDSIEGLVRTGDSCNCTSPRLEGDDNGFYSVTVHRLSAGGNAPPFLDTATATVVALASAPKYPRHITGAAYFDTARVVLRFVPLGGTPPVNEANLRITIPAR